MELYKNTLKRIKDFYIYPEEVELTMNNYMLLLEQIQYVYMKLIKRTPTGIEILNVREIELYMIKINKLSKEILSKILKIEENEIENNNKELFKKKNKDYGSSYEDFGLIGIIVRLNDKINRLKRLTISKDINIVDEKIEDTINDLYNYTILALMCNK